MKNLIGIFVFIFTFTFANAQTVQEAIKTMSKGANNAYSVELPQTKADDAVETWKKFMKDYKAKTKWNKKTKEWFSDDAEIEDMSENTVDIYTTFTGTKDNTTMTVWYDLGGAYMSSSSHPKAYPAVEQMLTSYALTVSTGLVQALIDEKAKEVEEVEKEWNKLDKENKDLQDKIDDARKSIAKMEMQIKENSIQLTDLEADLQVKKTALAETKAKLEGNDKGGKKNKKTK